MNHPHAKLGLFITYYAVYRDRVKLKGMSIAEAVYDFPKDDAIRAHTGSNTAYLDFILDGFRDVYRASLNKSIIAVFYALHVIRDLVVEERLGTDLNRYYSMFSSLAAGFWSFNPREVSKDAAILANYHLGFALVNRWELEMLQLRYRNLRCTSPALCPIVAAIVNLHERGEREIEHSLANALRVDDSLTIYSEQQLREVSPKKFREELRNLKEFFSACKPDVDALRRSAVHVLFDEFAEGGYDEHEQLTNHVKAQTAVMEPSLRHILRTLPKKIKILDVATGTGVVPRIILESDEFKARVESILGLDISDKMIHVAASKCRDALLHLEVCDVEDHAEFASVLNKFASERTTNDKFDLIVASFAFAWVTDGAAVLRNIKEHLTPGGMLLLLEEFFPVGEEKPVFSDKASTLPFLRWLIDIRKQLPVFELIREVERAGFKHHAAADSSQPIDGRHDVVALVFSL